MIRLALFAFVWIPICCGADAFVAEALPTFTTNRVFSATASSNWVVFTVLEPPITPYSFQEPVLYARRVPSSGNHWQRIAISPSKAAFGTAATIINDTLIAKDYDDTYFFHDAGGTWIADGKIDGNYRTGAAGIVVAGRDYLISGSEVYEWPSRKFVQTLTPPLANATFVGLKLAVSYSGDQRPGVWLYEKVDGLWANPQRLAEPDGTQDSLFVATLAQCFGFILVGAPGDDEGAPNSGAVHVYMADAGGVNWFYHQKLKPAISMAGDGFGSVIVTEGSRVYVTAPYRNEERQHAGAIFVYELRAIRGSINFHEVAKITYKDTFDNATLGLSMAARNGIVYGMLGQNSRETPTGIVAFHPPVRLTPWKYGQSFGINLTEAGNTATWETSTDLNGGWQPLTPVDPTVSFQRTADQAAVFFRIATPSAF